MGLENKISMITTIPFKSISRLQKVLNMIHSDDLYLANLKRTDNIVDIEFFEGTLKILIDDDVVKYKFIPNKEFEDLVVKTIKTKSSKLQEELENSTIINIDNKYKEIL